MSAPLPKVQTSALVQSGSHVDVKIDALDALQVGQTLRALARDKRTPLGARESLGRVGSQLVAAALLAMNGGRS